MNKQLLIILLPLFLWGCGIPTDNEPTTGNDDSSNDEIIGIIWEDTEGGKTDITFDPNEPILDSDEVDWLEIDVPFPKVYDYSISFSYRLSSDYENIEKLSYPIIEQRKDGEWIDVTPEAEFPEIEYIEIEEATILPIFVSIFTPSCEDCVADVMHPHGEYRAVETFTHYENEDPETVQVAVPFEIVAYRPSHLLEDPDYLDVTGEQETISQDTDTYSITIVNNHEEWEIQGGEYFRGFYYEEDTNFPDFYENTPQPFYQEEPFTLAPGEEVTIERTLRTDEEPLELGTYRIHTRIEVLDGSPYLRDETVFDVMVEYEVAED